MSSPLISIENLPRQNASQVKNKWGEVVRQVRQNGSVAITHHSSVEMVLLDVQSAVTAVQGTVLDIRAEQQRHV